MKNLILLFLVAFMNMIQAQKVSNLTDSEQNILLKSSELKLFIAEAKKFNYQKHGYIDPLDSKKIVGVDETGKVSINYISYKIEKTKTDYYEVMLVINNNTGEKTFIGGSSEITSKIVNNAIISSKNPNEKSFLDTLSACFQKYGKGAISSCSNCINCIKNCKGNKWICAIKCTPSCWTCLKSVYNFIKCLL